MKMRVLTVAVLAALASHAALADPEAHFWEQPHVYGAPAMATTADRIVHLGPNSHRVDVAYGETVRFVAESGNAPERSFTWQFDVPREGSSFDLSRVAPADFPSHKVRVVVSPDPLYLGG
jgi:hypothetical protein